MLTLTPKTRIWLSKRYPRLLVSELKDRIVFRGALDFNRSYNDVPIEDSYAISLVWLKNGTRPKLRETSGRLDRVFEDRDQLKDMVDLHVYTNGTLCIMAPQEWAVHADLQQDIPRLYDGYVEPYFYSQSFFERNNEWPWQHYPHNLNGIIAWFVENHKVEGAAAATAKEISKLAEKGHESALKMIARAQRRNSFVPRERCLCGKKKSYLMCHPCLPKLALVLRMN